MLNFKNNKSIENNKAKPPTKPQTFPTEITTVINIVKQFSHLFSFAHILIFIKFSAYIILSLNFEISI